MSASIALSGAMTLEEEWANFKAARRAATNKRQKTGDLVRKIAGGVSSRNTEFLRDLDSLTAILRSRGPHKRVWSTGVADQPAIDNYHNQLWDLGFSDEGTASGDACSLSSLTGGDTSVTYESDSSPDWRRRRRLGKHGDRLMNGETYDRKADVLRTLEAAGRSSDCFPKRTPPGPPQIVDLSPVRNYIRTEEGAATAESFDTDTNNDAHAEEVDEMDALQLRRAFQLNGVDLGPEDGDVDSPLRERPRTAEDTEFFEDLGLNEQKHSQGPYREAGDCQNQKLFVIPAVSDLRNDRKVKRERKKLHGVDGGTPTRSRLSASPARQVAKLAEEQFPPTPTYLPPPVPKRHVSTPPAPDKMFVRKSGRTRKMSTAVNEEAEGSTEDAPDSDDGLDRLKKNVVDRPQNTSAGTPRANVGNMGRGLDKPGIAPKKEVSFDSPNPEVITEDEMSKKTQKFSVAKGPGQKVKQPSYGLEDVQSGHLQPGSRDPSYEMKGGRHPLRTRWSVSAALRKFVGGGEQGNKPSSNNKKASRGVSAGPKKNMRDVIFGKSNSGCKPAAAAAAAAAATGRPVIGPPVIRSVELDKWQCI